MINNNILAEKSKAFGVRIVNCRKYLTSKKHEYTYHSMKDDCDELMRILAATIKSARDNS